MADPILDPTPAAPARSGRGLRIALGLSLAVNLLILGLVAGAALHGPPDRSKMERDLNFGPFAEALRPEDRRALRREILQRAPELRESRDRMRLDLAGLLEALRADPFDPVRLEAVMNAQQERLAGQIALGANVIRDYLTGLDAAERRAFADRLEHSLNRGPDEPKKD